MDVPSRSYSAGAKPFSGTQVVQYIVLGAEVCSASQKQMSKTITMIDCQSKRLCVYVMCFIVGESAAVILKEWVIWLTRVRPHQGETHWREGKKEQTWVESIYCSWRLETEMQPSITVMLLLVQSGLNLLWKLIKAVNEIPRMERFFKHSDSSALIGTRYTTQPQSVSPRIVDDQQRKGVKTLEKSLFGLASQ